MTQSTGYPAYNDIAEIKIFLVMPPEFMMEAARIKRNSDQGKELLMALVKA